MVQVNKMKGEEKMKKEEMKYAICEWVDKEWVPIEQERIRWATPDKGEVYIAQQTNPSFKICSGIYAHTIRGYRHPRIIIDPPSKPKYTREKWEQELDECMVLPPIDLSRKYLIQWALKVKDIED